MSSRRSRSGGIDDGKHVQPVVQIAAELFFRDHRDEVAIRRGDQPDVHADRSRAAQPLELLFLQHPQQLRLQLQRNVADFVEEQRAAVAPARSGRSRCAMAPVNAPFSWPNSSLSSRPVGMAAQFSLTNVRPRRPLRLWMARAISSLPVPVSPWINTVESVGATISTCFSTCFERRALADDLVEVVLGADLVLEVQLLGAQLLLQFRDLSKRQRRSPPRSLSAAPPDPAAPHPPS